MDARSEKQHGNATEGKPAMSKNPLKVTSAGDREVRIERVFDAPRSLVWRAFTDPKLLVQWWGRGNKLDVEKHELKRGGHWRFVEHADGEVHGFEGRFREVTPETKLVQTFDWDGMPGYVAINDSTFDDLGGGRTRVVTVCLFHTREECDGMVKSNMEVGLGRSYAALDKLLSSLA